MKTVYLILVRRIFYVAVICIFLAMIIFEFGRGLGGTPQAILMSFFPFSVYAALLTPITILPQALAWIKNLPITKKSLFFLCLAVNLSSFLIFIAAALLAVFTLHALHPVELQFLDSALKLWKNAYSIHASELLRISRPGSFASVIAVCEFFVLFAVIPLNSYGNAGLNAAVALQKQPRFVVSRQLVYILLLLAAAGIVIVAFNDYVFCGAGAFFLLTVVTLIAFRHATSALGFFGSLRRRIIIGGCLVAFVLCLSALGVAVKSLHSASVADRIAGAKFLGPWAFANENALVSRLSTGIDADQVKKDGIELRKMLGQKCLSPLSHDAGLDFQRAIESKTGPEAAFATLKIFDPKKFGAPQLEWISANTVLTSEENAWRTQLYLIRANITIDEMIRFLNSDNRFLYGYSLMRSEYYRDERLIKAIETNLGRYVDADKSKALLALSFLIGRRMGYDDYANIRAASFTKKLAFMSVDCQKFKTKTASELKDADEGALNICLSEEAAKTAEDDSAGFYFHGWYSIPLSKQKEAQVNDLLFSKRK